MALMRLIPAVSPANLARLNEVNLDPRALACCLALCLFTALVAGLAPAMTTARHNLTSSGWEGGRGIAGGIAARRMRRVLVVVEFALAMVLLVGAGLLVRSLRSVENVDLGFNPERVLSLQVSTTAFRASPQRLSFYNGVLDQIQSLPGVERAAIIGDLFVGGSPERAVTAEGAVPGAAGRLRLRSDEVSSGLFHVIGTPLLHGRFFSAADGPDSPPVAIVNDAMARRLWPAADPVGKRFKIGAPDSAAPWFTVVGIVADMRRQGLEQEPVPQMFQPLAQNTSRLATLLVRTTSHEPLQMAAAVQAAVQRVDKRVPLYGVTTLDHRLGAFLTARRFRTSLLAGFSFVALLMAAIGIYGLIRYSVATRTREIGIRMAVGAQPGEIFLLIIGEGLKLSLTGLALGLVGAWWLGRAGSNLLFGVTATDPLTLVTVSLLLTAVAAAACYFPARRAMKAEPTAALRQE